VRHSSTSIAFVHRQRGSSFATAANFWADDSVDSSETDGCHRTHPDSHARREHAPKHEERIRCGRWQSLQANDQRMPTRTPAQHAILHSGIIDLTLGDARSAPNSPSRHLEQCNQPARMSSSLGAEHGFALTISNSDDKVEELVLAPSTRSLRAPQGLQSEPIPSTGVLQSQPNVMLLKIFKKVQELTYRPLLHVPAKRVISTYR
jgi:hypothetical protein